MDKPIERKESLQFVVKFWRLMKPFHKGLVGISIMTCLFEIVRLSGPYLFGRILDLLIQTKGQLDWTTAIFVVGGLAGVRFIALVTDQITGISIAKLLWVAERYISTASFTKLLTLSMDYHERENTGTKIGIVNKGTDKLVDLLASFTFEFQPIVFQLVVTVVLIWLTSWPVGIIFALSLIPFFIITFKMFQHTSPLRTKRFDAYEVSSGEIGDTITNITVVKAFAQEKRENNSFQTIWGSIQDLSVREFKTHTIAGLGRSILVEIFYVTLLLLGIFEIHSGNLTVGSLVFLISLIERAYSNVYRLGRIYNRAADAAEPVERISKLLDRQPTIVDSPNAYFPDKIEGGIRFKNVSFKYQKKIVLNDVDFIIPAGSFTAIVGKSGGGKSTIAKLISRYYDPTSGQILIDNKHDLKELTLDKYRQDTAVVFQDSPVPNRKIWQVIAYAAGLQEWSTMRKRVIVAAKLAHADEFIRELDDGYQTLIGERGVKLSGGQRQRLAIARALFVQPKILIMDEPTSHLDTLSEHLIQKSMEELSRTRSFTKIVIAHRLSTVAHADQILVMDNGQLMESGTHQQLMKKKGVYAQIVHQSEIN